MNPTTDTGMLLPWRASASDLHSNQLGSERTSKSHRSRDPNLPSPRADLPTQGVTPHNDPVTEHPAFYITLLTEEIYTVTPSINGVHDDKERPE